jgi:UDP-glucuronate decarboxylase
VLPRNGASWRDIQHEEAMMHTEHNGKGTATPDTSPVLVAGGAGFLGSHLCDRLLAQQKQVTCIDNFATGLPDNVAHMLGRPGFRMLKCNIAKLTDEDAGVPAAIFNLACPASPVHYQRTPLSTLLTSVNGTNRLLQIARRCGTRIFQASTSEVYGNPAVHPQTETYWGSVNPYGPRSCYDEGKRCAETLCYIYENVYGVSVRIARIFNTYGPRMRVSDGRVVSNFIVQALRNENIKIYGDGHQTRSFCYVDDLIDAILHLMNGHEQISGPVNLGNPVEVEVIELAQRIIDLTGSRSRIVARPLPVDDPPRRKPDITRARTLLHWQPRVSLEIGLALTIADFERRLSRSSEFDDFSALAPPASALAQAGEL